MFVEEGGLGEGLFGQKSSTATVGEGLEETLTTDEVSNVQ